MPIERHYLGSASPSFALAVLEYLEHQGIDPEGVLGAASVRDVRQGPDTQRLTRPQWQGVLQHAGKHLNDPAFPLKLAEFIKIRHLGMLGFLLTSCDTLGAAATTLQRYEHLLDSTNEAEFHAEGEHCTLTWRPLIENPPVDFIMLSMGLWVHQARKLAERPDLVCDACFAFAEPGGAPLRSCFESTFGGRVQFNKGVNQLRLPVAYLSVPVALRDRHVHASLRQQAEADLVKLLGQDHGFMAHLETLLTERLPMGEVTLQHVAAELQLAPRTLQTRLEQHGETYREVLDRVRYRQAERLLRSPGMSLANVAGLLGFSDQSGFQHAFKRWAGVSPGDYRRRLT